MVGAPIICIGRVACWMGPGKAGPSGYGAAGAIQLGQIGPEHRPVLAREDQERGIALEGPDEVARPVAIEVRRRPDEPGPCGTAGEPEQPGMIDAQGLAGLRNGQGIPHDLAGHSIETDDAVIGPLDQVGLARRQLDRHGIRSVGGRRFPACVPRAERLRRLFPHQTAFVKRQGMGEGFSPVDGESISAAEPARSRDLEPIVAGGQRQRRSGDQVDRLADRLVGRLAQDLHSQRRSIVGQDDAALPPLVEGPPGGQDGEVEKHRCRDDHRHGADRLPTRRAESGCEAHRCSGMDHRVPIGSRRGRLSHRYALLNIQPITIKTPAA